MKKLDYFRRSVYRRRVQKAAREKLIGRASGVGELLLVNGKPMRCHTAVRSLDARTVMRRARGI